MVEGDRFIALRAGGDDLDFRPHRLFDSPKITLGVFRQITEFPYTNRRLRPSGQVLVHRFHPCQHIRIVRQCVSLDTIDPIGPAQTYGVKTVQHIQLGDAKPDYTVDATRMTHCQRIEPTAAPGRYGCDLSRVG